MFFAHVSNCLEHATVGERWRATVQQHQRTPAKVRQSLRTLKKEGATQHELSLIAAMVSMIWPPVRLKLQAPSSCRCPSALYRVAPLHPQSPQPRWSGDRRSPKASK
jgi:hypothetical protein